MWGVSIPHASSFVAYSPFPGNAIFAGNSLIFGKWGNSPYILCFHSPFPGKFPGTFYREFPCFPRSPENQWERPPQLYLGIWCPTTTYGQIQNGSMIWYLLTGDRLNRNYSTIRHTPQSWHCALVLMPVKCTVRLTRLINLLYFYVNFILIGSRANLFTSIKNFLPSQQNKEETSQ